VIAVISGKGGVGTTTIALLLGHTLAGYRSGGVVAVDAAPRHGDLADRVRRTTTATVTDLVRDAEVIRSGDHVPRYTSRATSGLEVVASPDGTSPVTQPGQLTDA
jgi:MinD-like ATPase involved in chromosome partitioning or flagellar assembly